MAKEGKRGIAQLSEWEDAGIMLEKAAAGGVETAWDRLGKQKYRCTFCEQGLT